MFRVFSTATSNVFSEIRSSQGVPPALSIYEALEIEDGTLFFPYREITAAIRSRKSSARLRLQTMPAASSASAYEPTSAPFSKNSPTTQLTQTSVQTLPESAICTQVRREVYARRCAACHGEFANNDGVNAPKDASCNGTGRFARINLSEPENSAARTIKRCFVRFRLGVLRCFKILEPT